MHIFYKKLGEGAISKISLNFGKNFDIFSYKSFFSPVSNYFYKNIHLMSAIVLNIS